MTKRMLILIVFSLLIPSTAVFASTLNTTRVNIFLSDSEGRALSHVQVSLDLYFYEVLAADQMELRGAVSDECTSDEQGMCSILIGETQDLLLRGTLDLGEYGSRFVEWQGGVLDVPIRIAQAAKPQFKSIMIFSAIILALIVLCVIVQRKRARA